MIRLLVSREMHMKREKNRTQRNWSECTDLWRRERRWMRKRKKWYFKCEKTFERFPLLQIFILSFRAHQKNYFNWSIPSFLFPFSLSCENKMVMMSAHFVALALNTHPNKKSSFDQNNEIIQFSSVERYNSLMIMTRRCASRDHQKCRWL